MSEFLNTLKARMVDAQARLQQAQITLQQAQADHQAVAVEYASWQQAVAVESRKEQRDQGFQLTAKIAAPSTESAPHNAAPASNQSVNKTELIREALRQHSTGITPADLWRSLKDQVPRNYVYAVLSRLKESEQVVERGGKYYARVASKAGEDKDQPIVQ